MTKRMGAPPISREVAERSIEAVHECMGEGLPSKSVAGKPSAHSEAARRLGIRPQSLHGRLLSAEQEYGLKVDPARYRATAPFTLDDLPHDGEPTAEELIAQLSARHRRRQEHHEAAKLRQVRVNIDGPIGIAFFGDPHIDDGGCAWGDLERDVALCRDTPGMLAVNIGDSSNNWVGRLAKLYAMQEVTAKQSLTLIEWLMTSLPWLVWEPGNHGAWNTDYGDPAQIIHRLSEQLGVYSDGGARLQISLPGGANFTAHVRHDFPGGSQFNPAHALVRETLFGYRDHILACGHRHTSGYIPVWHNDPRRLCHGMRVGTYKDFDSFAKERGFQEGNWARSMVAVVDPAYVNDPVRFIRPCFSIEEGAEYLTWRRAHWEAGRRSAA